MFLKQLNKHLMIAKDYSINLDELTSEDVEGLIASLKGYLCMQNTECRIDGAKVGLFEALPAIKDALGLEGTFELTNITITGNIKIQVMSIKTFMQTIEIKKLW